MLRGLLGTDLARDQDLRARAAGRRSAPSASRCWSSSSLGRMFGPRAWPRRSPGVPRLRLGRSADLRVAADRRERRAVARRDHRDLPRGRHPEAAARDAAAAAHHPDGARARQAALHRGHARADGAGRPALLPGRRARAARCRSPLALLFSTVSILSLGFLIASIVPTARFAQPIGDADPLSDARPVRAVRADRRAAAGAAGASRACCRSPTRCRCCEASGAATRGWPTAATSRRSC